MASYCGRCGAPLGFMSRFRGGFCSDCSKQEQKERRAREEESRQKQSAAREQYRLLLDNLTVSPTSDTSLVPRLASLQTGAAFGEGELRSLQDSAFRTVATKMLADDTLSEEEEDWLGEVSKVLGVTQERFNSEFSDLLNRLVIARINDGRLPVLETSHVIAKKGETVHGETNAQLMKEVSLREYRGGYSGFSFRIAKGVRWHVGGARGHSVVVGTKLLAEDNGILSVTSQRAVFLGSQKTIELPYSKLLNLGVFTDGVQFHMSNRTKAPLFALANGEVIAAMVNGAVQHSS